MTVDQALSGEDDAGFARALAPRPFVFPEDHGPHPGFKNEWWYLTGNLAGVDGRRFGFQATFFRIALAPGAPQRESAWATRQVWMVHAALSDVAAGRHIARERFARGALGLAGAQANPLRVWVEEWRLEEQQVGEWRLLLDGGDFSLDLALEPLRPPLLQGDKGLSRKSAEPGNASYYYSITRLATGGRIRVGGREYPVQGLSWLDREWSTSALGKQQVGWDWFSLQLDEGSDLMFYHLRERSGESSAQSAGSVVRAGGTQLGLKADDVILTARRWWENRIGVRYPIAWELYIKPLHRRFVVEALIAAGAPAIALKIGAPERSDTPSVVIHFGLRTRDDASMRD